MFKIEHYQDKTLLIVDDDAQNRELLLQFLDDNLPKLEILLARDGEQALELLQNFEVHLLILDWEMPKLDGLGLLKIMKDQSHLAHIPVLMYTGAMTETQHLQQALELGALDFLRKPAHPIELLARLRNIFRQQALEQARKEAEHALLQNKIQNLHQQLNQKLLRLAEKNKFFQELIYDIQNTDFEANKLLRRLRSNLEQEEHWDEILQQFQHQDPHFLRELHKAFPDLSPAETRLSALLRLGLDNKSIAHLLHISIEGVKKNRYRLRKKLNLESEENLEYFLLHFES